MYSISVYVLCMCVSINVLYKIKQYQKRIKLFELRISIQIKRFDIKNVFCISYIPIIEVNQQKKRKQNYQPKKNEDKSHKIQ